MVEYPERRHFTGTLIRPLREGAVELLREAVIVVDVDAASLPLTLADAARASIFCPDADDPLAKVSLYALWVNDARRPIADVRNPPTGGRASLTRYLGWRLPREEMQIPTTVRQRDLDPGMSHPVITVTFRAPEPKSVAEATGREPTEPSYPSRDHFAFIGVAILVKETAKRPTLEDYPTQRPAAGPVDGVVSVAGGREPSMRTLEPADAT